MNKFMIIFLAVLFIYCIYKKINIFEIYIDGVKDSLKLIVPIFTSMLAFYLFVSLFKTCGIIHVLNNLLSPYIPIPFEVFVIALFRPISANVSLSYLYTLYKQFGVDHIYCLFASLIQCSSDTTLYVVNLYFSSLHIKDTRGTIKLGLFMDFLAFFIAFLILLKMIV